VRPVRPPPITLPCGLTSCLSLVGGGEQTTPVREVRGGGHGDDVQQPDEAQARPTAQGQARPQCALTTQTQTQTRAQATYAARSLTLSLPCRV
jgi:hypothetical protein